MLLLCIAVVAVVDIIDNVVIIYLIFNFFTIKNSNLADYFTEVITSEASNSLKPNKEIFEYALKVSNANVETSIMIGDNEDADIQGAINAGMDSIFVNHLQIQPTVPATHTITHLKELENIF